MGLLDSVVGALGAANGSANGSANSGAAAAFHPDLLNAVVSMLGNNAQGGGLGALISRFQQGGLGDVMASWISNGQNLPVSADQLGSVLGHDTLSGLAHKTGLPTGDLSAMLAQMLPQIVDRLTPQGQVPQGGVGGVGGIGDLLGGLLRG